MDAVEPDTITLIPSARRLMDSLRDIGYDPATAVADLIDNSIAANATEVSVDIVFEGAYTWVRIADNGWGMTATSLDEAMRYGSQKDDYDRGELGKFGLGLKTASLSQCKRLTVASRSSEAGDIEIRQWDLVRVERTDRWEVQRLAPAACRPEWIEPLARAPGTVVVWDQLDRLSSFRLPDGKAARNAHASLCRDIEEHVAMVFHRFLSREARRPLPFTILVNGNAVEPWDPFARTEKATDSSSGSQHLSFEHDGQQCQIVVTPYVLPSQAEFSSADAFSRASGPRNWNQQQGFYIYRNDRMIQAGGWNRLRTPDEHTKLARVSLDFTSDADEAFGINVAKMRVRLPEEIRRDLKAIADGVARKADAVYRRKPQSGGVARGVQPSGGERAGAVSDGRQPSRPGAGGVGDRAVDPLRSNPSTASAILDANDDARRVEASVNGAAGISGARVREPGAHPGVGEGLAGRTAGSNPGGSSDDRQTVGQVADARSILRAVVRVLGRVLEGDPSTLGRILRAMADEVPGIGALLGPDGTEATRDRLEPTG